MNDEIENKKIPDFLLEMLKNQYGEVLTNKITKGYLKSRKLTFRVNTLKTTSNKVENALNKNNMCNGDGENCTISKELFY